MSARAVPCAAPGIKRNTVSDPGSLRLEAAKVAGVCDLTPLPACSRTVRGLSNPIPVQPGSPL